MNVSLPDSLRAAAEQLAARCGFHDASEYLSDLVRREWTRAQRQDPGHHLREALAGEDGPESVSQETLEGRKAEVEGLLVEGLASGTAGPLTPQDWRSIAARVAQRLGKPLD